MKTQQKHILSEKIITSIGTWKKWREAFQSETRDLYLSSLIFYGFETKIETDEEEAERIIFFLELADNCDESLQPFGGNIEDTIMFYSPIGGQNQAKIREELSKAAYKALSRSFFKNTLDNFSWYWFYPLTKPEVIKKIFWFFRKNNYGGISNLRENQHYVEVARRFIKEICYLVWEYESSSLWRDFDEKIKGLYRESRISAMETLIGLKELDILLEVYDKVDQKSLDHLEKIVMNTEFLLPSKKTPGHERRKPEIIEEVLASATAQTLFLLKKMISQEEKNQKLRELLIQEKELSEKRERISKNSDL
jgi:hypothetical protein